MLSVYLLLAPWVGFARVGKRCSVVVWVVPHFGQRL